MDAATESADAKDDETYTIGSEPPSQSLGPAPGQPRPARLRTQDVVSDVASFRELMVSEALIKSLSAAGFERPSPVQKAAIPLGRVGTDLIVQAKSGTGKTVVFAVICLERIKPEKSSTQALVLAPTREIAIQSEEVIRTLAGELPPPTVTSGVFVGGLPMVEDEKKLRRLCHVAVGTPGRVGALLAAGRLVPDGLALLVLDEADSLLGDSFYEDVTWIYDQLPKRKQVLAFSATYTPELLADLEPLMRRPQRVMMCAESVSLLGVKQFYALVPTQAEQTAAPGITGTAEAEAGAGAATASGASSAAPTVFRRKVQQLLRLLGSVSFHQAAVFCNHKPRAEWLAEQLNVAGYPAAYLSGDRAQGERMEAMAAVRGFKLRVVVSTDVMARGVDLERVNLVVNLDLPYDAATYMHRVGRTGRFGSRGVCVSYVTQPELALLVSYVDEQAAAAAAATVAATAAKAANGGGAAGVTSEEVEPVQGAGAGKSATGGVEGTEVGTEHVLMPLPETIPEDLYGYELGSDWERQALESLVQKERQTRQQLLLQQQQGVDAVAATACSHGAAVGVGWAGGGEDAAGPSSGEAAAVTASVLPELPPLPEEVKAAQKAEQAAQKAARKAEKELQKQLRREQQQQPSQEAGQQQRQQQHCGYGAYGYDGYSYGAYGYGSYSAPYRAATASGTGNSSADLWEQYGRDYYQHYYSSQGSPSYPGYDAYYAYGQQGQEQEAPTSYSHQDAAAAWADYYSRWRQAYGSTWPAYGGINTHAGSPGAASDRERPAAQQPSRQTPAPAASSSAGVPNGVSSEDRVAPGAGRVGQVAAASSRAAPPQEGGRANGHTAVSPRVQQGAGAAGAGAGAGGESDLSFEVLRGEAMAPANVRGVPAVLLGGGRRRPPAATTAGTEGCSEAAASSATAAAGAEVALGSARCQDGEGGGDEEEEGEEEEGEVGDGDGGEDDSWVLGEEVEGQEEDFTSAAANVIDNLMVLLPPGDTGPGAGAGARAEPAAEGAGVPTRAAAAATVAEDGAGHGGEAAPGPSGDAEAWSAAYAYPYDPYYGWAGYSGQQWPQHSGAYGECRTSQYGPGWGSGAGAWQDAYSHGQWGHAAPHGPHPPHGHHHRHRHHRHPPPHHDHPPPRHRHPPPSYPNHPPPYHPGYYQGYNCATTHASPYQQDRWGYGGGISDVGLRSELSCSECMRRLLREYIQQHSTWQQAYAVWYGEYKRWYDEWLQEEADAGA